MSKAKNELHDMLYASEAAMLLRCSIRTIQRKCKDGEIPSVQIWGRYRIPKEFIDNLLNTTALLIGLCRNSGGNYGT